MHYNDTNNAFALTINNYSQSTHYKPFSYTGGYLNQGDLEKVTVSGAGIWRSNSAVTSISFLASAYALNGGTVKIYGVK